MTGLTGISLHLFRRVGNAGSGRSADAARAPRRLQGWDRLGRRPHYYDTKWAGELRRHLLQAVMLSEENGAMLPPIRPPVIAPADALILLVSPSPRTTPSTSFAPEAHGHRHGRPVYREPLHRASAAGDNWRTQTPFQSCFLAPNVRALQYSRSSLASVVDIMYRQYWTIASRQKVRAMKKKMGRPPTGHARDRIFMMRVDDDWLRIIDDWRFGQLDPKPSRSEAVRALVAHGIEAKRRKGTRR